MPLVVYEIRTARDCRAFVHPGRAIPPGGNGAVVAWCDTSFAAGRFERKVTVYSSDPTHERVVLALRAEVAARVFAEPPEVYAGFLGPGDEVPRKISLRSASPDAAVTKVRSSGAVLEPRLEDGPKGPQVVLRVRPEARAGDFEETVVVEWTGGLVLRVPVVGTVRNGEKP
ncbi:MAG: hypothetical protein KatS3mg076_1503 [Candidatus Binatia bacterium]|nr:MAG: hypothetical protein KatS3mg076_1503 [Candidatus Binatia bacterium]